MIRSCSALALLLATSIVVVIGCSGGGSSHSAPGAPALTVVPNPSASAPAGQGAVTLSFQIARPNTASAKKRSPQYLPSWTTSVAISINGGTATNVTVPGSSCTASGGLYTCTVNLSAPLGSDTFTIIATDTSGYALAATAVTSTVVNAQNTISATAGPIPAQFKFSQNTAGQDACPIVSAGSGQTSTWTFVTYDADYLTTGADSAALTVPGPLATTYAIWNDGSVSGFQLASSGGVSVTSGALVNNSSGSVQTTYNSGGGMVTFTMYGLDAFNLASGALVTLNNRGSSFNVTPLQNTTSYQGHYVFVNNTSTTPHETDIWDVCKRSRTGADSILPAPANTPNIQGPVVLDSNGTVNHFFQLYANTGFSGGQIGLFNYAFPAFTPGTNTPPLLATATFSGSPVALVSGGGAVWVTTGAPSIVKYSVTETATSASLTSTALVTTGGSGALSSPGGIAYSIPNTRIFVADSGANALYYYPASLSGALTCCTTASTPSLVPSPYYLATSTDGVWVAVAAYPAQAQVSVINAGTPTGVTVNLSTSMNVVTISWTPPGSSGTCSTASNTGSGVLTVLEQSGSTYKVETFGGFGSGGSYTGGGTVCLTGSGGNSSISGSLLSTNTWIDSTSILMTTIFVTGTDNGGLNTNLQTAGTESWRAINRGNGVSAWTRTVSGSNNASTITVSK